ncbi:MAG: hypothetical protein MMC33_007378 [Icmadophila ericetorum]|nr:hypothetical protein [Icmadophila ericetorum]
MDGDRRVAIMTEELVFDKAGKLLVFLPGQSKYDENDPHNSVYENSESNILIQVSETHMRSASPVFTASMFDTSNYRFNIKAKERQLVLSNDDPTAMLLAMSKALSAGSQKYE